MNVLMVVAPQSFRDEEFNAPRSVLQASGHAITIASLEAGPCKGVGGTVVNATVGLDAVRPDDYAGVVFVGGPGARVFFHDPQAHRIAQALYGAGRVVAAICVAPAILAHAGVLKGRRATVFPSENAALFAAHALVRALGVVTDGTIVTASGPEHAHAFGVEVARVLAAHSGRSPAAAGQATQHLPR